MKIQIGARTLFRNKTTQAQIGDNRGFSQDLETAGLEIGADWTKHTHYWAPKEGFTAILEVGIRRRAEDPATTGQVGGRVRFRRDSDGVFVGTPIQFANLVTLADLQEATDWVAHTEVWDATTTVEGQLQVGVRKAPAE